MRRPSSSFMQLQLCQTQGTVRVVLDTNVLISACWTPGGLEAEVVALFLAGTVTACISPEVLAEYRDVLLRDKFAGLRKAAEELLTSIELHAWKVPSAANALHIASDDD